MINNNITCKSISHENADHIEWSISFGIKFFSKPAVYLNKLNIIKNSTFQNNTKKNSFKIHRKFF